jgi:hypothetical protein
MKTAYREFCVYWERWLDDCLIEFNDEFGEGSHPGVRKYHQENCPEDYDPGDLVEFAENGDAYPHSRCGTNWIPKTVTPWEQSKHYHE